MMVNRSITRHNAAESAMVTVADGQKPNKLRKRRSRKPLYNSLVTNDCAQREWLEQGQ